MTERRRFGHDALRAFAAGIVRATGVLEDHARVTAGRLLEADLRGRTGHGLIRVPLYVRRIEAGSVNLEPRVSVVSEGPTSALVDGDNGLGQVVMTTAAEIAMAKATESRSRRGWWMNSTRWPAGWASTNWPTDFGEDELREVAQP